MSPNHDKRNHESLADRNERIRTDLREGMLPVLPFEVVILEEQLDTIKEEQERLGKELGVVNHQSSETWHDNHAANEIQRYSSVVNERGRKLTDSLHGAVEIDYPLGSDEVTLGSVMVLRFPGSEQPETALLTGTVREISEELRSKFQLPDVLTVITLQSPVGLRILGKTAGEQVTYTANDRQMDVQILSIEQLGVPN